MWCRDVIVDDQVQGGSLNLSGKFRKPKILQEHSAVKQGWLVSPDNQGAGRVVRRGHVSTASCVITRRRDRVGRDVVSPIGQRDAGHPYVTGTGDVSGFRHNPCRMA